MLSILNMVYNKIISETQRRASEFSFLVSWFDNKYFTSSLTSATTNFFYFGKQRNYQKYLPTDPDT